mmetsp:Transcript_3256/g.9269  ORF Transcript_3256/g.9269 Transcript_3256/m.9269 type:complete len:495 (+) Transcript_3256:1181-2665(+)
MVLQAVSLVHHHEVPLYLAQKTGILQRHFKCCEHYLKSVLPARAAVGVQLVAAAHPSAEGVAHVDNRVALGRPFGKLLHPVVDGREGDDNEEGAHDAEGLRQVGQVANALDGLAKAHLIRQDAVVVLRPRVDKPVEASELVVAQLPPGEVLGLLSERPVALEEERLALLLCSLGWLQQPCFATLKVIDPPDAVLCIEKSLLGLPRVLAVREAGPLDQVLGLISLDELGNDAVDLHVVCDQLLLHLALDIDQLLLLRRQTLHLVCQLVNSLHVVLHPLDSGQLLQGGEGVPRGVDVRVALPFYVKLASRPRVVGVGLHSVNIAMSKDTLHFVIQVLWVGRDVEAVCSTRPRCHGLCQSGFLLLPLPLILAVLIVLLILNILLAVDRLVAGACRPVGAPLSRRDIIVVIAVVAVAGPALATPAAAAPPAAAPAAPTEPLRLGLRRCPPRRRSLWAASQPVDLTVEAPCSILVGLVAAEVIRSVVVHRLLIQRCYAS